MDKISRLGFGCMRLPQSGGNIDKEQTRRMFDHALDAGITYFDTAYLYHDGHSETALGELLCARHRRDSFLIADKLPGWRIPAENASSAMAAIVEEQLQRLRTDYFDFYLVHSLSLNRWQKLADRDLLPFLDYLRQSGKAKEIGFSFHGAPESLPEILDGYNWDFVQLQINYFDWQGEQDAKTQYELTRKRGLPVVIMEPVRGGALAKLPEPALLALAADDAAESRATQAEAAALALRWCATLPGVRSVLSGMSNMAQLIENIATLGPDFMPLRDTEYAAVERILSVLSDKELIPCTTCGYCLKECPQRIDIPGLLNAVNEANQFENDQLLVNHAQFLEAGRKPADCTACANCALICPQGIDIPAEIAAAAKRVTQKTLA